MENLIRKSWWVLALQGLVALLFGLFTLLVPGLTVFWLVALFAAYALLAGAAAVAGAVHARKSERDWWLMLLLGLVSIAASVITVLYPALTALVLVLVIAANALITGVLQIAMGIRLRKTITKEWMLILTGVVSIAFAVLVFMFPGAGLLAVAWLVGFYATFTGVLLLVLAFRVRARSKGGRHEGLSLGQP